MKRGEFNRSTVQATVDMMVVCAGNRAEAARRLKLAPSTLTYHITQAQHHGVKPSPGLANPNDVQALRGQMKRMEAELKAAAKAGDQMDIIKGVIGSLARKVEELDPPKWVIQPMEKASAPGVPTLLLSDFHWGECVFAAQINNVNSYDVKTAHQRLEACIQHAIQLLKIINPSWDYPGIVMPLGGDMISGNIHEELTATNEIQSMPAVLDLFGVLVSVILAVADTFGKVFIPCVSGNHGRDTHKIWNKGRNHTSFDWLLYRFLAKRFEDDKRVTFFIPDGPDAYYKVYDHAYLLTHGDQFRGGDGLIGCLGPIIRGDHKKRSRNAQVDMEYDTMLMGHWHQYIHHSRVIVNGSLKGYDEYAYSNNFGFERPQQALWLTHPQHGITFRMPVFVDRARRGVKTTWVSVPE